MFSIGNEELETLPRITEFITCGRCGKAHEIVYGQRVLNDGARVESKSLAYYICGGEMFLAGIDGKDVRGGAK
jgi:hypothetical protein